MPTVPRELRAELAHRFDRGAMAEIRAPTLLLVGSESPDWAVRSVRAYAGAIRHAERIMLDGHGHSANMTAPDCSPPSSSASSPAEPSARYFCAGICSFWRAIRQAAWTGSRKYGGSR